MKAISLRRRTFLRGLGGIALALPALEAMAPRRAEAAVPPKRYVYTYCGASTGRKIGDKLMDAVAPVDVGLDYTPSPALQHAVSFGVMDALSVVSGLKIPWQTGSTVPPGGRITQFHFGPTVLPQLSGMRTLVKSTPGGPTSDQIMAAAIGGDTTHPVLAYRVQPVNYNGGDQSAGNSGRLTWKKGSDGKLLPIDPIVSPRAAFKALFSGFIPDDADPAAKAQAELLLARRKSVLDLIADDAQGLLDKLGKVDRERMERHYDEIRALENQLEHVPEIGGACKLPLEPGDDPAIGGSIVGDTTEYSTAAGYSNEELRAKLLCDLIRMAFACDLSRVSALMWTMWKCYMNAYEISGQQWKTDVHSISHSGLPLEATGDAIGWHVKHFARLMKLLRDTPEVDGSTLLDHTALVMTFEGGGGFDPEANNTISTHSSENMVVLVGGKAGGLNADGGRHIRKQGAHPVNAVLSAMKAAGYGAGADEVTLGEVTGHVPELFG
jgi:hypothetical protein